MKHLECNFWKILPVNILNDMVIMGQPREAFICFRDKKISLKFRIFFWTALCIITVFLDISDCVFEQKNVFLSVPQHTILFNGKLCFVKARQNIKLFTYYKSIYELDLWAKIIVCMKGSIWLDSFIRYVEFWNL